MIVAQRSNSGPSVIACCACPLDLPIAAARYSSTTGTVVCDQVSHNRTPVGVGFRFLVSSDLGTTNFEFHMEETYELPLLLV